MRRFSSSSSSPISSIVILFLLLFFAVLNDSVAEAARRRPYLLKRPQCTEAALQKIELLLARAQSFGPNGRRLPETFEQMKAFCRESVTITRQIDAFSKACFEKTVKDYTSLVVYTVRVNLKRFCGKQGSKMTREFLKMGPCANRYIQPNDHCFVRFINATKGLINIADDSKKFPHVCCNFVEGVRCGETFLNSVACIRPYVPMLMDLFRGASSSIADLACGEYNEGTDACEKLGPPPKPLKPNRNRYSTVALVLIELLASIKDESAVPSVG